MNPASKDIAQFLDVDASLALTLGTDLFFGRMPDVPDDCVAVLDNPGDPPLLTYEQRTSDYYFSSVSVRVRNTDYATGWAKAFAILKFLHALNRRNSSDNVTRYMLIKAIGDPQVLYWDENDRVIFFINFEVQRKPI